MTCWIRRSAAWSVAVAAVLAAGLVAPAGPPAAAAPGDTCLVRASYYLFLGREPTGTEIGAWSDRFDDGEPRSRIAGELARSDEWLGVEVARIYLAALDRAPDDAGRRYWVQRLRAGARVHHISSSIFGSDEFYARAGGTPDAFVTDLYDRILRRTPDAGDLAYWGAAIERLGRGRVAASFFSSVESRGRRVTGLYQQILGRSPEAGGLDYWVQQLVTLDDVRLAVMLASSPEFRLRANDACSAAAPVAALTHGRAASGEPDLSADGRHVVFESRAADLVPGDDNDAADVFSHDLTTGTTVRITDGDGDSLRPSVSADGRFVAFESAATDLVAGDDNDAWDVFLWDRDTGTTTRITDGYDHPFGLASDPVVSGSGGHVAFATDASNLVAGDDNDAWDVFVWDRSTGTTTRITDGDGDSFAPTISDTGGVVAFTSYATDLVPGGTTVWGDIFVWTRAGDEISQVTAGDNVPGTAALSGDGRWVTFDSAASDLVPGDDNEQRDVFIWDRNHASTIRITDGDDWSGGARPSTDGRWITFESAATDLVPGDDGGQWDVFVWDRDDGTTIRITDGDMASARPSISGDGRLVAFSSAATDLAGVDTNGTEDVFIWTRPG